MSPQAFETGSKIFCSLIFFQRSKSGLNPWWEPNVAETYRNVNVQTPRNRWGGDTRLGLTATCWTVKRPPSAEGTASTLRRGRSNRRASCRHRPGFIRLQSQLTDGRDALLEWERAFYLQKSPTGFAGPIQMGCQRKVLTRAGSSCEALAERAWIKGSGDTFKLNHSTYIKLTSEISSCACIVSTVLWWCSNPHGPLETDSDLAPVSSTFGYWNPREGHGALRNHRPWLLFWLYAADRTGWGQGWGQGQLKVGETDFGTTPMSVSSQRPLMREGAPL